MPVPVPSRGAAHADVTAEVLVLGAGPGGYSAAFRAADLGKKVVLVDSGPALGGVCLNVGCIPSKALLHVAKVIAETKEMSEHGMTFGAPTIDVEQAAGVEGRSGRRAHRRPRRAGQTTQGHHDPRIRRFTSPTSYRSSSPMAGHDRRLRAGDHRCRFRAADAAVHAAQRPSGCDSTGALELTGVPQRLLVLGGGIIGLEMATVYHELGAKVTIAELMDQLIPGADEDLINPLTQAGHQASTRTSTSRPR